MKTHLKNSYTRKIHKQRNIIISLVKNPHGPRGGQLSKNQKGTAGKVFKVERESPWDATLEEPVLGLIRM